MDTKEISILYTNWRGETAWRRIVPEKIWWGTTLQHAEPQWLLTVWDVDKEECRDFALRDIERFLHASTEQT